MIERFGMDRLFREGLAVLVHEDETGRLWRRRVGPPTTATTAGRPLVRGGHGPLSPAPARDEGEQYLVPSR